MTGPRKRRPCACDRFADFGCGEMIPDNQNWAPGHAERMLGRLVDLLRAAGDTPSVAVWVNPITALDLVSPRMAAQLRAEFTGGPAAGAQLRALPGEEATG